MDLTERLAAERRGRLAAERLLELKSRELFEANKKLSKHALTLSDQIVEQRGQAERMAVETQQVKAELQRAEEHVEVVERRLWDSIETITDGFAVFDAQDKLIAANTAWLSIFDFTTRIGPGTQYLEVLRAAVEEGHVDIGDSPPGEWVSGMLARWDGPRAAVATIRTRGGAWYRLIDRRSRDGDMVCIAQNITALKEREAELDEARLAAEAANRAKSSFLANMSHELRTPMNGVVGMAEMMLEGEEDEEKQLYLSTIRSSGEALLQIINQILDFSKMEAERLVLRPEPFDLERLVHEVLTLLSPTARGKSLRLHADYDMFLPTRLVGDPARLRQILINIVGNAVKFTETGHVLVRVTGLEADAGGWQIILTIEDTGIGIPMEMRDHIFGSFAQVESETNRRFEGTGLGLAISRQLVELMGGEIWVESEEGRGSCFGVRLTLPDADPRRGEPPRIGVGSGRALVVGGDGLDTEILCRQLAQLGLDVDRAATGSDALAQAARAPAPLIVATEEVLPDVSGPDLAVTLTEHGCRGAKIVICDTPQDAARLGGLSGNDETLPAEVNAVLARPILRSQLFSALLALPAKLPQPPRAIAPGSPPSARTAAEIAPPSAPAAAPAAATPDRQPARPAATSLAAGRASPPAETPAHAAAPALSPAPPLSSPEPATPRHPAAENADVDAVPAPPHTTLDPPLDPAAPRPLSRPVSHAEPRAARPVTAPPPPPPASRMTQEAPRRPADARPAAVPQMRPDAPATPEPTSHEPLSRRTASREIDDGRAARSWTRPDASAPPRVDPGAGSLPSGVAPASPPVAPSGDPDPAPLVEPVAGDAPPAVSAAPGGDTPPTDAHAVTQDLAPPEALPEPAIAPARPMRVLAAEDNKTNRFVLAKMLQKLRIELHFAEDGVEAVDRFAELEPDLVFMDISMPRMDGKEATRRIRAMEEERGLSPVPIVAMTAHAMAGDREEILAAGIDHYMTKPLKRAQIEAHVIDNCPTDRQDPAPAEPAQAVAG